MNCLTLPPKESKRGEGGGMIIALAEQSDWLDEEPISSFLSLMGCLFGGSGDPSRRRLRGLDSRVRAGSPSIHHRGRTGRRRDITHKNASINNLSMGGSGRRRRGQKQFPPLFCVFWSKKKLSFFFAPRRIECVMNLFFPRPPFVLPSVVLYIWCGRHLTSFPRSSLSSSYLKGAKTNQVSPTSVSDCSCQLSPEKGSVIPPPLLLLSLFKGGQIRERGKRKKSAAGQKMSSLPHPFLSLLLLLLLPLSELFYTYQFSVTSFSSSSSSFAVSWALEGTRKELGGGRCRLLSCQGK